MEKRARTRTKPIPVYPCEICNENMFGREKGCSRRRFCTSCLNKRKAENHETFCCAVCGKEVTRRKHHKKEFNAKVCSLLCQQKWRVSVLNAKTERARKERKEEKVKEKAKRFAERKDQLKLSVYWSAWMRSQTRYMSQLNYYSDVWFTKIYSRLCTARPVPIKRHRKFKYNSSGEARAIYAINRKLRYMQQDAWIAKIGNRLSNHSKRLRRKNESKKANSIAHQGETRGKWIQMCFDWLVDHA